MENKITIRKRIVMCGIFMVAILMTWILGERALAQSTNEGVASGFRLEETSTRGSNYGESYTITDTKPYGAYYFYGDGECYCTGGEVGTYTETLGEESKIIECSFQSNSINVNLESNTAICHYDWYGGMCNYYYSVNSEPNSISCDIQLSADDILSGTKLTITGESESCVKYDICLIKDGETSSAYKTTVEKKWNLLVQEPGEYTVYATGLTSEGDRSALVMKRLTVQENHNAVSLELKRTSSGDYSYPMPYSTLYFFPDYTYYCTDGEAGTYTRNGTYLIMSSGTTIVLQADGTAKPSTSGNNTVYEVSGDSNPFPCTLSVSKQTAETGEKIEISAMASDAVKYTYHIFLDNELFDTKTTDSPWTVSYSTAGTYTVYVTAVNSSDERSMASREDIVINEHVHKAGTKHDAVAATCIAPGTVAYYDCTGCGKKIDENGNVIENIEIYYDEETGHHVGGTEIVGAIAATCIFEGYTGDVYCASCGKQLSSGETIPATGEHVWDDGEIIVEPTCVESGEKQYTCEECYTTKTVTIAAVGHKTVVKNKKAASYTAAGYTGDICCKVCGKVIEKGKTIAKLVLGVPSSLKLKAASKAITVSFGKAKSATGTQIQYSVYKSMTKASNKTSTGKSLKISKLKSGKKYYVRVRSYKKVGNKTVYSKWSSIKSIKTK